MIEKFLEIENLSIGYEIKRVAGSLSLDWLCFWTRKCPVMNLELELTSDHLHLEFVMRNVTLFRAERP